MDAVHAFAREGDIDSLVKCIENGVSVNLKGMCCCALNLALCVFKLR